MAFMTETRRKVAKVFFKELFPKEEITMDESIASKNKRTIAGELKRLGLRGGDVTSKDFQEPEFDMAAIMNGYNADSYIRQGVDKYIDQIFKEGFEFYGKNSEVVKYLKMRLAYIAEVTNTPTEQFLIDIAEDIVKYANCIIVKARATDVNSLPPGMKLTGLNGNKVIAGYYCLNASTFKVKRDKTGAILSWQQEIEGADKPVKFAPEDVVHIYYKRDKGNAFGTSFLIQALDDVRALRQAEENVLKMMYRNIHPFYHVAVGDKDMPGTPTEVIELQDSINNMNIEGGIATTNRVVIKPVASNEVINAEPYLRYLENRVFSGLGVPATMFGRNDTGNRSTANNMFDEFDDRVEAFETVIEMFFNMFIVNELLIEGGYDPYVNKDHMVEFRFNNSNLDRKIKSDVHAIYQYEHNAITEDEARFALGRDPITDRSKMHQTLITQANADIYNVIKKKDTTTKKKTEDMLLIDDALKITL